MMRIISRNIFSIFIAKIQRERELLMKLFNMVRDKEILLESQDGYEKWREIGYKLGEIAGKVTYNVFKKCQ